MRETKTTIAQTILNKINSKENFTYKLTHDKNDAFIVSDIESIYVGKNPSLQFDLLTKIKNIVDSNNFDSIGGWFDSDTNLYHVDKNTHYYYFKTAKLAGNINKQKAIFDINNKKVIYLNNK